MNEEIRALLAKIEVQLQEDGGKLIEFQDQTIKWKLAKEVRKEAEKQEIKLWHEYIGRAHELDRFHRNQTAQVCELSDCPRCAGFVYKLR